ncbi:MAG: 2-phospho-L-lactate transferase [SAR202 cluster bacterium]|nr:2-phospho-L-lactate transferase [Chloroflexota bacterium]MQG51709.1 2-phospho-L-lactate transferase [SAR202 cluster bacterium]|tara:strand:+ start:7036 stop:7992 length:957 start_codon:yes stop_codon:yes gene_type:complete
MNKDIAEISILTLAGGVGGAKLAKGLYLSLDPHQLKIVVNTADDTEIYGLYICPDLDTMMYSLSNLSNTTQGWGIINDSYTTLNMLNYYGYDTWFNIGDKDFATHILRTELIRSGSSLSESINLIRTKLGIKSEIYPMSDQIVRTICTTNIGKLNFQEYFVEHKCEPKLLNIDFEGIDLAQMSTGFEKALERCDALVISPSNPYVSIDPIVSINKVREKIENFNGIRIAVSPIVKGNAIKGPAAKMLDEFGEDVSCVGIANLLRGICDILIIDTQDLSEIRNIEKLGINAVATNTIMNSDEDKKQLAKFILEIIKKQI